MFLLVKMIFVWVLFWLWLGFCLIVATVCWEWVATTIAATTIAATTSLHCV